jgi:hypothetical protein
MRRGVSIALGGAGEDGWSQTQLVAGAGAREAEDGVRRLVTGTDLDGRSFAVDDAEVDAAIAMPGFRRHVIFASDEVPHPARPVGLGTHFDMDIPPGAVLWYFTQFDAGVSPEVPFHHTDTIDIGVLLDGSIDLILGDGTHELRAGDCFVVNGDDHSWRVGPDGCWMCSASIGTPSPGGADAITDSDPRRDHER